MLKIRLARTGRTKRPHFRIVVAEHRKAAQGPYIESLGFWDPIKDSFGVNPERLKEWEKRGAWATDRISRLFKKHKVHYKLSVIDKRPDRGPKKLEPKPELTETVKVSDQATVRVEKQAPKEGEKAAEQVESAGEVSSSKEEGEERTGRENDVPPLKVKPTPAVEGETQENQSKSS
jgi:small subunit ribosomal protein S16